MRLSLLPLVALLAACAPAPPMQPAAQVATAAEAPAAACARRGGAMRPVGRLQTLQCVVRYGDAGRRCTSGEQCQGDCRIEDDTAPAEGQPAAGQCQASSNRFGCYTRVENGRAAPTICVD